ncbi:hypothetical protein H7900_08730 [Staphylococcus haemolyticus]|uniref:YopX family protein n=1 Tax=Staphylococcus haemolyticus TaxID=1283 RepID=UPI001642D08E|nr:YopX family protein [Staphylococcus haemolyticus]MBC3105696.1 hypothetical protein [Staphylococcus haemolyticus]
MIPKFRIWDKTNKEMLEWEELDLNKERDEDEITIFEPTGQFAHPIFFYDAMQSTGLIDKNGVEIYEGDIVRYNRGVSYSVEKFPYSVKYIEGAFVFEHGFIQHNLFKNVKYVTVIGNIYENPELLEGE